MATAWHGGRSLAVPALVAVAGLAASAMPVSSAVRHCAPRLEAQADDVRSEAAARRRALELWIGAARQLGEPFTRWQLATGRSLECVRIAGGFRCRAGGAPCAISQVPGEPPKGLPTPPPPQPVRPKGLAI